MQSHNDRIGQFYEDVALKFQLYNGLFTALPFHSIENTGVLLSVFLADCEEGFRKKKSPEMIVESFFKKHTGYITSETQQGLLFRFIQYAERQVVLFDAVEDAAFTHINDMDGPGSLSALLDEVKQKNSGKDFQKYLAHFSINLVLTAHPTQFYPDNVLAIINDLSLALKKGEAGNVNLYLQQLGKTAFLKKQKPTPVDEAVSLIWFLENVFYDAVGNLSAAFVDYLSSEKSNKNPLVKLGFWPGGDRDGNPFVDTNTTLLVAQCLKKSILKCYYRDVRILRRRLTFEGVEQQLASLEKKLYDAVFLQKENLISVETLLKTLGDIKVVLVTKHQSLFLSLLDNLIQKIQVFGFHFASLDIRQDSSVHESFYTNLSKIKNVLPVGFLNAMHSGDTSVFSKIKKLPANLWPKDPLEKDCLSAVNAMAAIQKENGTTGCYRYIVSHSTSAASLLQVMGFFLLAGFKKNDIAVDLVPLFETVEDLVNASEIMRQLFTDKMYMAHLQKRNRKQTIMVGFSDGTKDGGYLTANWSIFLAKKALTSVSKAHGIEVVFFDGRGGPPARGGGKSHKFYASMGSDIAAEEIQLTIQGQTISSNFGTPDAARFNIEQLLHAGLSNKLFTSRSQTFTVEQEKLLTTLSDKSLEAYLLLKNDPAFLPYLQRASPLEFYGSTNIGSRPAKRGAAGKLSLQDLRAIPFVGAWSQLKQNVTGFYGLGTALKYADQENILKDCTALYQASLFFRTMIDNCEMALKKCFFPLTAHLAKDKELGHLWRMIFKEYELTIFYLQKISGHTVLMQEYPIDQLSIQMRERIMLPLLTIQQYAIAKFEKGKGSLPEEQNDIYGKLVMRCSFGIINAGRNSA